MASTVASMDPIGEFNALLTRAGSMVDRLATGSGPTVLTTGKSLPEVATFQEAWNGSRDLVGGELDAMVVANTGDKFFSPQKGSSTEKAMKGLVPDGIYGANTATALALTLWARLGTWEEPAGIPAALMQIPTNPKDWPVVWASDRAFWSHALSKLSSEAVLPPPEPAPVPDPADRVVSDADSGDVSAVLPGDSVSVSVPLPPTAPKSPAGPNPQDALTMDGGGDLDFSDSPELVRGQTKGEGSSTTLLVVGAGLLVAGGVVAYTASRKARRRP